jgi:flagellar biosynthesis regulator FlbT
MVHKWKLKETTKIAKISNNKIVIDEQKVEKTQILLKNFINNKVEPVKNTKELAMKMARITLLIRESVLETLKTDTNSDILRDLRVVSQDILISEQTEAEFADMFAQTIAYGLFIARLNHDDTKGDFKSSALLITIPQNYPFLRNLFATIEGPSLDDAPYRPFVNELTQLLSFTDKGMILIIKPNILRKY